MPAASNLARAAIRRVTVRSSITPELTVDPFAPAGSQAQGGGGLGDLLLRAVAPTVELDTAAGPVTVAPWGQPRPVVGLALAAVTIAGAATIGWLVLRGITAPRARRRR